MGTAPRKGRADYLALGNWNALCSMCGRKRKASEMVRNWEGQYRCPVHNEIRQPQDFVRGVPDIMTPPWVQPPPTNGGFLEQPTINITEDTVTQTVSVNVGSPNASGVRLIITIAENVTLSALNIEESTSSDAIIADEIIINNSGIVENFTNPDDVEVTIRNWGGATLSTGYILTVDADTVCYNVYDEFVLAYGVPPVDVVLEVIIDSGIIVSSDTPGTAAITWGTSWTGTPEFSLTNEGYIIGLGGDGGLGAGQTDSITTVPGAVGDPGGNAIDLDGNDVSITNASGFIFGGGGGGGGGTLMANDEGAIGGYSGGGGGGVGAGTATGTAGTKGSTFVEVTFTITSIAEDGVAQSGALPVQTGTAGGIGGITARVLNGHTVIGGAGGVGGDYGEDGSDGEIGAGTADPIQVSPASGVLAGGLAGKAVELGVGGSATFVSGDDTTHVKGAVS